MKDNKPSITRKSAIKKIGWSAFSAATMMILLNDPLKAQPPTSHPGGGPGGGPPGGGPPGVEVEDPLMMDLMNGKIKDMNLQERKNRLIAILGPLGIYGLSFLGLLIGYSIESANMLDFFSWTLLGGLLALILSTILLSRSDSKSSNKKTKNDENKSSE